MKKNKKKVYLLFVLAVLIIVRLFIHFQAEKESILHFPGAIRIEKVENAVTKNDHLAGIGDSKKTIETTVSECHLAFEPYSKKEFVLGKETASVRFVNVHKKIDGQIYRFRFFYKETSENEVKQFLLYKEDSNEVDHLIEVTPYKKGKLYQSFEKRNGEIIYKEEGINVGENQDLFFHFENDKLKKVQGRFQKKYFDCAF